MTKISVNMATLLDEHRLLRVPDAAALLDVSESTLKRWRSSGAGPRVVILQSHTVRYRPSDLDAWMAGLDLPHDPWLSAVQVVSRCGVSPRPLSSADVAALLDIRLQTLHNWNVKRIGPPRLSMTERVRYALVDLIRWIDESQPSRSFAASDRRDLGSLE